MMLIHRYHIHQFLLGDNSDTVPPDSIPNSEVKRISGDGSVGFPHVRVAHRQAPITKKGLPHGRPFFVRGDKYLTSPNVH